jgi:hypothetical protein
VLAPLGFGKPCCVKMVASAEQMPPAPHDIHSALGDAALDTGESRRKVMQPPTLLPPLRLGGVAAETPNPTAGWYSQSRADAVSRPMEADTLVKQIAMGALPLNVAVAGDRSSPSAGAGGGQLSTSAGPLLPTDAKTTTIGQVPASQMPKVLTDLAQYGLIVGRDPQSRANLNARWRLHYKPSGDRAKDAGHGGKLIWPILQAGMS